MTCHVITQTASIQTPNIDFTTLPHAWQSSNSLRGQRGKDALCLHLEITGVGPVVKRETQTLEPI